MIEAPAAPDKGQQMTWDELKTKLGNIPPSEVAEVFLAIHRLLEPLVPMALEVVAQDNAITFEPIFLVEERDRVYGVDSDYSDGVVFLNEDGDEQDDPGARTPTRTGYIDRWDFVQAFFTRKGAEDYIRANAHNLNHPRVYVASGFRNYEWQAVRKFLSGYAAPQSAIGG